MVLIFSRNDTLKLKGELVSKNLNMNRVYYIGKEIGKIPLLSFGNSGSDSSIAELALQNPHGIAFMILCGEYQKGKGGIQKKRNHLKNLVIKMII